jgi:choline dehydrogenase
LARQIYSSREFRFIRGAECIDNRIDFEVNSESYVREAVRQLSISACNAVGTCKMGDASDANAVVDSECRVFGIQNLRVADASIIPEVCIALGLGWVALHCIALIRWLICSFQVAIRKQPS